MSESLTGYLAAPGYQEPLRAELGEVCEAYGDLLLSPGPPKPAAWAANVWYEPQRLEIDSIGHAARLLRGIQRNWVHYGHSHHRRASLIADRLPHVSGKPLQFPDLPPAAPLGSWTLLDQGTLLAAPRCSSPVAHGAYQFVEDREQPPNRAYLKLFEGLTRFGAMPGPGDRCLDLGSSPGGWTWVLAKTGAKVLSVDKAPLDPAVAHLPGVEFRQGSAFALRPQDLPRIDWLCCDIACYPQRLFDFLAPWLAACPRFLCTLKFQGETDHEIARRFASIPGSKLVHLHHNKHELTWMRDVAWIAGEPARPRS